MKNLIAIIVFFFSTSFAFAQDFDISEAARAKESGTYNSFLFELPDVSKKDAEDEWSKFLKEFKGKSKRNKKANLWIAKNVKMPALSNASLTISARILEDMNPKKRTSVIVWFETNGSEYVNSDADSTKGDYVRKILTEYAMNISRQNAQMIADTEEKDLKKLEGDLKDLKKDHKKYLKEIEDAKESLSKNEKNIEINEQDQTNMEKDISRQMETVKGAKMNVKKF